MHTYSHIHVHPHTNMHTYINTHIYTHRERFKFSPSPFMPSSPLPKPLFLQRQDIASKDTQAPNDLRLHLISPPIFHHLPVMTSHDEFMHGWIHKMMSDPSQSIPALLQNVNFPGASSYPNHKSPWRWEGKLPHHQLWWFPSYLLASNPR